MESMYLLTLVKLVPHSGLTDPKDPEPQLLKLKLVICLFEVRMRCYLVIKYQMPQTIEHKPIRDIRDLLKYSSQIACEVFLLFPAL